MEVQDAVEAFVRLHDGLKKVREGEAHAPAPMQTFSSTRASFSLRQSHTEGDEMMATTKTKTRQRTTLPSVLVDILRWHIATQLTTPEQKASELLLPAEDGGLLAARLERLERRANLCLELGVRRRHPVRSAEGVRPLAVAARLFT